MNRKIKKRIQSKLCSSQFNNVKIGHSNNMFENNKKFGGIMALTDSLIAFGKVFAINGLRSFVFLIMLFILRLYRKNLENKKERGIN